MARRVKKTDTREVDHWVSTDDGRHLPIDKDGNIIFGSSKKSTSKSDSKYKKNLNGTYQRQEKRDGTLVQATIIPGRDKGKDFYTIKTGIGDDFESSDERYSTLSSAKNAADKALENRLNSKENTSKSDSSKKKAIDEDKMYEIADRYNSSEPVSGDWNTELDHEIATIQKEFGLSKSEAKDAMKKYLGFTDDDFADDEPVRSEPSKSTASKPSSKSTSKPTSSKEKETSKKSKVEFKEFKPEPWMDEEEMAEALVDSKDYIGDRALYQGVKDDLKSSGYSMGTKLTVDHAELVEYDGKSRYGTVEATYTIRDNGDFYGKKGTEYTERFQVPVVKDYSDSTSKSTSTKKDKPPIEDRFSFKVAMPHPNASIDSQMKATTKLAVSQITKQFEDSGIKLSKVGAFDGSQFFIPDKGSYVVELSRTSRGDSKNQVSFNTRIWDNNTATGKTLMKRFKGTLTNSAPTRKPASSKTNKIRQLMGNDRSMVEWKINRAYDKTSLKELALDAGVPSSKVRTMSTEELRAMLLSMWKGR